jgi:hypothetical protein
MTTVTVTETPSQDQYAPSLSQANDDLRQAVAQKNERHATAPLPPVAEAACDVSAADCCQGSRMPTLTNSDHAGYRPGTTEFLAILDEVRQMHLRKTLDYGTDEDALSNIRQSADVIGSPAWAGAILRISDKMHRLRSFFHRGAVEFDGVEDTLLDITAYAAIALVLYREHQTDQE